MSQERSQNSDCLVVPTNVQAFVVGRPSTDPVYDLAPVPREPKHLDEWYAKGKNIPRPFEIASTLSGLESGVHLHWALPAALMQSLHGDNGKTAQPCLPNRWLVLRMWHAPGKSDISWKAWVVESDYLSDKGTPFPFFGASPPTELQGKALGYVGRTEPVETWQETHPQYRFELNSIGWGDPSFAAYYPACNGMFGFHDRMEGIAKGHLLSYLVTGWYSDPARDPIHPGPEPYTVQGFKDHLTSLRWSCSALENSADAELPRRSLCAGSVVGIKWQGSDHRYPASQVDQAPTVTIGGSAAEALATLLAPREEQKTLQRVLCVFQDGQATQVSDSNQFGELLHRQSFSAMAGGKYWTIEPVDRPAAMQSSPPPLSANIQALLRKLNEAQRAFDSGARELESYRWRLFASWATWVTQQTGPPSRRAKRDSVDSAGNDFRIAAGRMQGFNLEVENSKAKATLALTAEGTGMKLAESTLPPFLHPKDPFLILKGENLVGIERARAQRPDQDSIGKDAPDGDARDPLLPCRLARELVSGMKLTSAEGKQWQAQNLFNSVSAGVAGAPLEELTRTLALETLLFDPNCADLVAAIDAELFSEFQRSLEPSYSLKSAPERGTLTWFGRPPDPLGVTRWGESNPWLPVYLMWQAHWAPAYAPGPENKHSTALVGWQLDSDPLVGDLVPQSSPVRHQSPEKYVSLEGATIVSTVFGKQLAKNLDQFAKSAGTTPKLSEITDTQVLGQSLGGLNELLLRQSLGVFLPPKDPSTTAGKQDLGGSIWEAMGKVPQPFMPDVQRDFFLPVRAGGLKLVNLWIVDSFGQTRKLIDNQPSASKAKVIASATLPPPPAKYDAGFSPRLVQPVRLNFDWQPADNAASGPVCGWIVPNFLEKNFSVFSESGSPLGLLRGKDGTGAIGSKRLQRFVTLVAGFSEGEWLEFLELVEVVLRKTDGRVPPEDPALAVLLGRPLALVHASLRLELRGLPAGYWTKGNDSKFVTEDFEKLRVPMLLGDMKLPADGLVGYLLEPESDENSSLFASAGAKPRRDGKIKYEKDLKVSFTEPVSLTLLMDASARVHATTGILPRHSVVLPPEATRMASLIEEVSFSAGPVLGERPLNSGWQPTMPRPSDAFGQWSWATRPSITSQTWHEIRPADDRAQFADDLALTEGWLKLRLKPGQGESTNRT
jgi:hypothetical protein